MTQKYDEFMLEHKITRDGNLTGIGTVMARRLQHIFSVQEEMKIEDEFMIRGWNSEKRSWDTLVEKNFFATRIRVRALTEAIEEEALEMAY